MQSIRYLLWFLHAPQSIDQDDYRFYLFLNIAYIFAFIAHVIALVPLYFMLDNPVSFVSETVCVAADLFCLVLVRKGWLNVSLVLFFTAISAHTTIAIIIFGGASSLSMYYITMLAMSFLSRWKLRYKVFMAFVMTGFASGLNIYSFYFSPVTEITMVQHIFWSCSNIIVNCFAIGYGVYYFSYIADSAEQKLMYEANHDLLTGVLNRNAIMKVLLTCIVRGQTRTVAVIMGDIDHFKNINDTYGHLVGDEVLKDVSRTLGISLRDADALGRFGGEEFIIVLPGCHLSAALGVAERIRRLVDASPVSTSAGIINLTMSFGVSYIQNGREEDTEGLLKTVDKALYLAKNNGRNRVEFA